MIIRGARRSPIQKDTVFDIARGFKQVSEIESSLKDLHAKYESLLKDTSNLSKSEIDTVLREVRSEADRKLAALLQAAADSNAGTFKRMFSELQNHVDIAVNAIEHAKTIQKGDPGEPGVSAITPVRGVDYFTSEDVQILVQMVLNQIRQPKDGNDAIVTDDMMQKHLDKFIKEKKIKVGHIDGMEQTLAPIRSLAAGFRGGGDTLKAGTNTTLTRNSDGTVSVNASASGGSGYQAPSSGSVNGSNATFVWATAPNAIVVDQGRAMQKTNSDGSANWSGTTTTILTVAPTFDIYALA